MTDSFRLPLSAAGLRYLFRCSSPGLIQELSFSRLSTFRLSFLFVKVRVLAKFRTKRVVRGVSRDWNHYSQWSVRPENDCLSEVLTWLRRYEMV